MTRIICLFLLFFPASLFAQKQNNTWYFGQNGNGISFTSPCNPMPLSNGSMEGFEGVASIADEETGEILFYTNSGDVWNKNHELMENGNLLSELVPPITLPFNSISQVVIVPAPGAQDQYYIITTDQQGQLSFGQGLSYHKVDLSFNQGLGKVVEKNIEIISNNVMEQLIATPHQNGQDYWIIGHEFNSNAFLAFLLDENGIAVNPIVSYQGSNRNEIFDSGFNAIGQLAASPNGQYLAMVSYVDQNIELFKFDASTGVVFDPISLEESGNFPVQVLSQSRLYGLSFSPNSSKLYTTFGVTGGYHSQLIQFDISSLDPVTINASKTVVYDMIDDASGDGLADLELTPDGKIYVSKGRNNATTSSSFLGIINQPDAAGLSCEYLHEGFEFNGAASLSYTLNNISKYVFYDLANIPKASPGNIVFEDLDGNDYFSSGDLPLAGILVTLFDMEKAVASTLTDEEGHYSFSNICSGEYTIGFSDPTGTYTTFVLPNVGDESIDSDVSMGEVSVDLTLGDNDNLSIGAGFKALTNHTSLMDPSQNVKVQFNAETIHVKITEGEYHLQIYSHNGQLHVKQFLKVGRHEIKKSEWASGMYYLVFTASNGRSWIDQIIIAK